MYGMKVKTTLYMDRELKDAVERAARLRKCSEAEVIRSAIAKDVLVEQRPRGGFLSGPVDLSERVDEYLEGFGDWRQR